MVIPEYAAPAILLAKESLPERLTFALPDGYVTHIYLHRPSSQTDSPTPVVYLHGIQSHPGWFYGSARAIANAGHPVYQITRRGSGENTQDRGHACSPRQLLDDLDAAVDWILQREQTSQVQLLGVSWGGKLATAWTLNLRRQEKLSGLTLVAPGICPKITLSKSRQIGVMGRLLLGLWRKQIPIPLNDPALFTDNPIMREYLATDPWTLHKATVRFMATSRRLDWILKKASPGSLNLPVHLILSPRDKIIDNAKTLGLFESLAGQNLHSKLVAGAHTLEFEKDPEEFFSAVVHSL